MIPKIEKGVPIPVRTKLIRTRLDELSELNVGESVTLPLSSRNGILIAAKALKMIIKTARVPGQDVINVWRFK